MQVNSQIIMGCLGAFSLMGYLQYKQSIDLQFYNEFNKDRKQNLMQIHQNIIDYDKNQDSYEKMYQIDRLRQLLIQQVHGNVLETGVGTSRNINHFQMENINQLIGIDYSQNMLEQALRKKGGMDYQLMDVHELQFPDEHFDSIVDTFGFNYYDEPQKAIIQIERVLKKGGKLLVIVDKIPSNPITKFWIHSQKLKNIKEHGKMNIDFIELVQQSSFKILEQKELNNDTIQYAVLTKQ